MRRLHSNPPQKQLKTVLERPHIVRSASAWGPNVRSRSSAFIISRGVALRVGVDVTHEAARSLTANAEAHAGQNRRAA